jgi:hypothetical protein
MIRWRGASPLKPTASARASTSPVSGSSRRPEEPLRTKSGRHVGRVYAEEATHEAQRQDDDGDNCQRQKWPCRGPPAGCPPRAAAARRPAAHSAWSSRTAPRLGAASGPHTRHAAVAAAATAGKWTPVALAPASGRWGGLLWRSSRRRKASGRPREERSRPHASLSWSRMTWDSARGANKPARGAA